MELSMKNSIIKTLSKLQTGAKRQIQIGVIHFRERGTKKLHIFKNEDTLSKRNASFKA
jgi:hypothetical protein